MTNGGLLLTDCIQPLQIAEGEKYDSPGLGERSERNPGIRQYKNRSLKGSRKTDESLESLERER